MVTFQKNIPSTPDKPMLKWLYIFVWFETHINLSSSSSPYIGWLYSWCVYPILSLWHNPNAYSIFCPILITFFNANYFLSYPTTFTMSFGPCIMGHRTHITSIHNILISIIHLLCCNNNDNNNIYLTIYLLYMKINIFIFLIIFMSKS